MKPFPIGWVAAAGAAVAVLVLVGIVVFRSASPSADTAEAQLSSSVLSGR